MEEQKFDLFDIVMKLNGHISAVGEHNFDTDSLKNLEKLTHLLDKIIFEIYECSKYKTRQEASMKAIGEVADKWISELGGWNHIE